MTNQEAADWLKSLTKGKGYSDAKLEECIWQLNDFVEGQSSSWYFEQEIKRILNIK